MQPMKDSKIVNDAIFGYITLKPYIVSIIDTVEFQRLRHIWQLGTAAFVYPTADHCRFEHSIGTYHLASKLINKLRLQLEEEDSELRITKKDVMCVEIAALCHDIGHGPFSHLWDNTVLPGIVKSPEKHEKHFLKFWEKIKNIDEIKNLDKTLIFKLINGKETVGKELLSNIVSNSESGMDVDKWDYLARDSMYLGHASTNFQIEIDRMIHFARAIQEPNAKDKDGKDTVGKWKIAFRKSESLNMLRVFQLRHHLYQTAYRHKTVVAIDQMMLDGFKKYFNGTDDKNNIGTSEWILENNDSIFWQNIKNVKKFQRIMKRDLYRPICEIVKFRKMKKHSKVEDELKEIAEDLKDEDPKKDDTEESKEEYPIECDIEESKEEYPIECDNEDSKEEYPIECDIEDSKEEYPIECDIEDSEEECQIKYDPEVSEEEDPIKIDTENLKDEDPIEDVTQHLKKNKINITKFRIILSPFQLGNKDPNPLLEIPFYRKSDPRKIFRYTEANIPSYLRYNVDESRIIILRTYKNGNENADIRKECENLIMKVRTYFDNINKDVKNKDDVKWIFEDLMTHD